MTQNPSLAEDLIQETFLRALMNVELIHSLRPEQQRAWLYRTAGNLYLDWVRHAVFETPTDVLLEETGDAAEYAEIENAQLIDTLPNEERLLFIMRYNCGYSSAELGELFGIPSGTVRSRLFSARKRLKNMWETKD